MKNLTEIHVVGGKSLAGNISIQGSKNAALPMMAAALMHRGLSILKKCPKISDVFCMEEILKNLGAATWWEDHDLYLDCTNADKTEIPGEFTRRMRSSVILLSAILARNHSCRMGYPGGCVIGKRPIDIHLMVLKKLGAVIREEKSGLKGKCIGFTGGYICFPRVSVGATQQAVMASVLAEGETVLENCAKEPEVVWLCRFLKSMGANIKGEGTKQIRICGVSRLESGNFVIPPDRIVAGTYICAAAVARSEITLSRVPVEEMKAFLEVYQKIGGQYYGKSGTLKINGREACRPVPLVQTEIYPGFPTDLQAPLMAVLTGNPGESVIQEQIFEDRFGSACQMRKMGAHIEITGNRARITGGFPLRGTEVEAGDLRGGAALVLTALMAEGETCIRGAELIGRGYEHICEDLKALGCRIWQSGTRKKEYE